MTASITTGELRNVSIFTNLGGKIIASGTIYNDIRKRFPDGVGVYSSYVVKLESNLIYTKNSIKWSSLYV